RRGGKPDMVSVFPSQSRISHLSRGRAARQFRRKARFALLLLGEGPVEREFVCQFLLKPAAMKQIFESPKQAHESGSFHLRRTQHALDGGDDQIELMRLGRQMFSAAGG